MIKTESCREPQQPEQPQTQDPTRPEKPILLPDENVGGSIEEADLPANKQAGSPTGDEQSRTLLILLFVSSLLIVIRFHRKLRHAS